MNPSNQTVTRFILLGFQNIQSFRGALFLTFLILFLVTVSGNLLIIMLVSVSQNLGSPMYFFLSHLSACDLLMTVVIVPLMLDVISRDKESITSFSCFFQFYLFGSLATTECLLLAVMSYDRYVAIRNPLRYLSVMTFRRCAHLVFWSWFTSFAVMLTTVIQVCRLKFCGPNVIDHFFCDLAPLLQLSCSDTSLVEMQNIATGLPATFFPLMYIMVTYICIFITIHKIPTTAGRWKAFYTCSSHLTVVTLYFGTLIVAYLILSKASSVIVNKVLSLLYTVLTPLVNPIIYSLRNKEIKKAFSKLVHEDGKTLHLWGVQSKKNVVSVRRNYANMKS